MTSVVTAVEGLLAVPLALGQVLSSLAGLARVSVLLSVATAGRDARIVARRRAWHARTGLGLAEVGAPPEILADAVIGAAAAADRVLAVFVGGTIRVAPALSRRKRRVDRARVANTRGVARAIRCAGVPIF